MIDSGDIPAAAAFVIPVCRQSWNSRIGSSTPARASKAAAFEPLEGDPLDLADAEAAAEVFKAKILRLAERPDPLQ
jgi:hypothetical protein